jgi:hypothetical protein
MLGRSAASSRRSRPCRTGAELGRTTGLALFRLAPAEPIRVRYTVAGKQPDALRMWIAVQ